MHPRWGKGTVYNILNGGVYRNVVKSNIYTNYVWFIMIIKLHNLDPVQIKLISILPVQ